MAEEVKSRHSGQANLIFGEADIRIDLATTQIGGHLICGRESYRKASEATRSSRLLVRVKWPIYLDLPSTHLNRSRRKSINTTIYPVPKFQ